MGRGLSITGVIVLHASTSFPGGTDSFIQPLNEILTPLRLPLFFLISGYFSGKVLRQPLAQLLRRRLWFFLVPYLIWASVDIIQSSALATRLYDGAPLTLGIFSDRLAEGITIYWFFQMLIIANLWLWATRKLNAVGALLISLSPFLLLAQQAPVADWQFKVMVFVPIFMIGARGRDLISHLATIAHNPWVLLGLGLAGVLVESRYRAYAQATAEGALFDPLHIVGATLDQRDLDILVEFAYRLALIPAAVALAVLISLIPGLTSLVQRLGRNTLTAYIGHPLGLFAFSHLILSRDIDFAAHPNAWFAAQLALCVVGCIIAYGLTRLPHARWLITPPRLPERTRTRTTPSAPATAGIMRTP